MTLDCWSVPGFSYLNGLRSGSPSVVLGWIIQKEKKYVQLEIFTSLNSLPDDKTAKLKLEFIPPIKYARLKEQLKLLVLS